MSIAIIFNPAARSGRAQRSIAQLRQREAGLVFLATQAGGDGRRLAAGAVRQGFTTVVAAGGDGTINEVLNGLGDVETGFAQVQLGLLPVGTMNVLAREMGIPTHGRAAWSAIERGRVRCIDLPLAEYVSQSVVQRRYFAQLAGVGLDACAIERVEGKSKVRWGPGAYVWAGCRVLRESQPMIHIQTPGASYEGQWVLVGNGRFYGGPWKVFSRASNTDHLLDVLIIPRVNWGMVVRAAGRMVWGHFSSLPGVRYLQVPELRLASEQPVPIELDGEAVGHLPLKISLSPEPLRVLVP